MFCVQCGGEIGESMRFCPKCGAAVGGVEAPVVEKKEESKPASSAMKWLIGVPLVSIVIGMFVSAPSDPEREKAKLVYNRCIERLSSEDRARNSANVLAQICENFRIDYRQKYGSNP